MNNADPDANLRLAHNDIGAVSPMFYCTYLCY